MLSQGGGLLNPAHQGRALPGRGWFGRPAHSEGAMDRSYIRADQYNFSKKYPKSEAPGTYMSAITGELALGEQR
jgi:hypothetical protein